MNLSRSNCSLAIIAEWLIILCCFGYPLQAMVVLSSNADSSPVNLAFRAFYLLLAGILLLLSVRDLIRFLKSPGPGKFTSLFSTNSGPVLILLIFWIIYGIRLIYELEYQDWSFQHYSDFYVYSWAFGCTLIPALAVLVHGHKISVKRLTRNVIIVLALANLCITFCLVYYSRNDLSEILGSRGVVALQVPTDKPDNALINSITVGLFGEWLALASLALFIFCKCRMPFWLSLLLLASFLLGIFNLLAGASRGPLLDFSLVLAGFLIIWLFKGFKKLINSGSRKTDPMIENMEANTGPLTEIHRSGLSASHWLWIVVLLAVVSAGIWKFRTVDLNELAIIPRVQGILTEAQEGSPFSRLTIWKRAWYQFTVNPVLGDSIINDVGYFYSHNIFLDSLMSVGIVGTIPFLFWFFLPFWYYCRIPAERKRELSVLFVLFVAAFLLSMTSGGLFTIPEVWILSAAVIGLSQKSLTLNT